MNTEDLRDTGWYLEDLDRPDLLRHIGRAIWITWNDGIKAGRHPPRAALLVFLRCWAAPVGDWLPPGMANYVADRLDPDVLTRVDRGGRPGEKHSIKLDRHEQKVRIATDVLEAWRRHKESKTAYPQQAAFETVARTLGIKEVEVRLAFSGHRKTAEARATVARGTSINSLSNEDLYAFDSGPKSVSDLIIHTLTPSERSRIGAGESLDSVLRAPDTDPSERPYPFLDTRPPADGT